jgi:predicted heme/steroid binding protein
MSKNRRAGQIFIKANGYQYDAKGSFTYNLGHNKRDAIVGHDAVHGFKTLPQPPFVEGIITDSGNLDVEGVLDIEDATVTLELANGKVILLSEAWYAHEGGITTEEGEIPIRFEGIKAEEIR